MKNKIIAFSFAMILAGFFIATIGLDDRQYSALENRYLQTMPKMSWKNIKDGTFMEQFETYMSDQIAGKDSMIKLKTDTDKLLHRQGANGVFFGKHSYYVKDYKPDAQKLNGNIMMVQSFIKKYQQQCPVTFLLAPNVQSVYENVLPSDVVMGDAKKDYDTVKKALPDNCFVNPLQTLQKHKKEQLYFRTDHHWTMRGAYYAYASMKQQWNETAKPLKQYKRHIVNNDFYGSLYSKAPLSMVKPDAIEAFYNDSGEYRVTFENQQHMNSLFAQSNLHIKDKYTYFLDGNHPFITIESNSSSTKHALVFKDSYSHALLPFLADDFEKIDVVDLRYYHEDIDELIKNNHYDNIIMIYNMDFFATDDNFIWLSGK